MARDPNDRIQPIHSQPNPEAPHGAPPYAAPYGEAGQGVPPPPPPGRFFSPNAVGVATFIGSPVAGGIVLALNYRRLGRASAATLAVVATIAATVALLMLAAQLDNTSAGGGIAAGIAFGMVGVAKALQGKAHDAHLAAGGKEGSSWLAAGIGLPFLAAIIGLVVYSNRHDLGTKVDFGHGQNIYFKDGVSRKQVKAMGAVFEDIGFFGDTNGKDVLVRRAGADGAHEYTVSFVVKADAAQQAGIKQAFRQLGDALSAQVFDGAPVHIVLLDADLDEVASLP